MERDLVLVRVEREEEVRLLLLEKEEVVERVEVLLLARVMLDLMLSSCSVMGLRGGRSKLNVIGTSVPVTFFPSPLFPGRPLKAGWRGIWAWTGRIQAR